MGIIHCMGPLYTRAGDDGTTGLLDAGRLPKHHPLFEVLGALEEASAALGMARSLCQAPESAKLLLNIQRDLYTLMAEVAASPNHASRFRSLNPPRLAWLEAQADAIAAIVPLPSDFIVPGDSQAGAALDLARTIVRRAERRIAGLIDQGIITNPVALPYLNRLSSFLFALELLENQQGGAPLTLAKE
jgi:cob(I)alamin adenosyltransferase